MTAPGAERRRLIEELATAYRRAVRKWQVTPIPSDAELKRLASHFPFHEAFPSEDDELYRQVASLPKNAAKALTKFGRQAQAMQKALKHLPDAAQIALKYGLIGFDDADLWLKLDEVTLCIERLHDGRRGKGQPKIPTQVISIAGHIIRDFEKLTRESAHRLEAGRAGPVILLKEVFEILGIENSVRVAVERALEQRSARAEARTKKIAQSANKKQATRL